MSEIQYVWESLGQKGYIKFLFYEKNMKYVMKWDLLSFMLKIQKMSIEYFMNGILKVYVKI